MEESVEGSRRRGRKVERNLVKGRKGLLDKIRRCK